jgi:hypothetical protein
MALASILAYMTSFIPGQRLVDGGDLQFMANQLFNVTTGITAHAGGGQTLATPLSVGLNRVDVVATAADSVLLPPAIPGASISVWNNAAANALQIFGQPPNGGGVPAGDQIVPNTSNTAAATAVGVSQANAKIAVYECYSTGIWKQLISN